MERVIVGIDPGKKGAIAILSEDGTLLDLFDMPLAYKGKAGRVEARLTAERLAKAMWGKCGTAVIEKVGYVPGDGKLGAFTFGGAAGVARGVVEALGFDLMMPKPQEWRKLRTARQMCDLSHDDYLKELKRRGILRADFDISANDDRLL